MKQRRGGKSVERVESLSVRERLQGTRKLYSVLGEKLIVSGSVTNEPVLTASYRIVGWVEEAKPSAVYHRAQYNVDPTTGKKYKATGGPPLHGVAVPFWLHMCNSHEIDVMGHKMASFPAAAFRQFFVPKWNPAFDELVEQGLAPSVPLLQSIREVFAGLQSLGYDDFIDLPRREGGDWFIALKDVEWHEPQ